MSFALSQVASSTLHREESSSHGIEHQLQLSKLDDHRTLSDKTSYVHGVVRQRFPWIDRIAIAKYDLGSDTLCTYVGSMEADNPLRLHEARLGEVPSLLNLVQTRETRVINDLSACP